MIIAFLRRVCESIAFRLKRAEQRSALRDSPLRQAGFPVCDTHALLRRLSAQSPHVIYDLGGNRGQWTLLAKSVFPSATVHAFEPLAAHCEEFRRHASNLPSVYLHSTALGEVAAELEMDMTSSSDSASLLPPNSLMKESYGVHSGSKVRVKVVPLDTWCETHGLPPPDLIKLDLQGYELQALRGGIRQLAHARAVILELSFQELYTGQPLAGEVIAELENWGFRLEAFATDVRGGETLLQLDALFLRMRK